MATNERLRLPGRSQIPVKIPLPARKEREMHTLGRRTIIALLALALWYVGFCPEPVLADGNDKNETTKINSRKTDAPAPLTERERLLLDRLEQLEQRVAELEAKSSPATHLEQVAPTPLAASNPSTTVLSPASASVSSVAPSGAAANLVNVTENAIAASIGPPQASEKDKSAAPKPQAADPFSFADFTWLNGSARTKDTPYATSFFTPEIRADVDYVYDFNHPKDDTIGGSSEVFRSDEVQVTQLGVGGDFHYDNVRARIMTQFGLYSQTTPRNDASPSRGQWGLDNAYRYISEAYGGYHFNVLHGINVDAGIFMSYIGLFSYYNFDNWAYQPSYVSSNTPWFFQGLRTQIYVTDKLKFEPWFVNGWQSYGKFNHAPGLGGQIVWRPKGWLGLVFNNYGLGTDTLGNPHRSRLHADYSVEVKYYDNKEKWLDKMAFSLTGDADRKSVV